MTTMSVQYAPYMKKHFWLQQQRLLSAYSITTYDDEDKGSGNEQRKETVGSIEGGVEGNNYGQMEK